MQWKHLNFGQFNHKFLLQAKWQCPYYGVVWCMYEATLKFDFLLIEKPFQNICLIPLIFLLQRKSRIFFCRLMIYDFCECIIVSIKSELMQGAFVAFMSWLNYPVIHAPITFDFFPCARSVANYRFWLYCVWLEGLLEGLGATKLPLFALLFTSRRPVSWRPTYTFWLHCVSLEGLLQGLGDTRYETTPFCFIIYWWKVCELEASVPLFISRRPVSRRPVKISFRHNKV